MQRTTQRRTRVVPQRAGWLATAQMLVLGLLVVSCYPSNPPRVDHCLPVEGAPLIEENLQATGLYLTDSSDVAPKGALQRADNAVLRDEGFLDPVRGTAGDVDFGTPVDALYPWQVDGVLHLVAHGTNNTLYHRVLQDVALSSSGATVTVTLANHGLTAGAKLAMVQSTNAAAFPPGARTVATTPTANTFTYTQTGGVAGSGTGSIATPVAYPGTYLPPTGQPMRFWDAGGALYFTTSTGPYRLDTPTSTPVLAGEPPGLEGSVTVAAGSWLNYGETVGYRTTWGKRTESGRLLLGAPSGRMLLTNTVQDATPVTGVTATRAGSTVTVASVAHGLSIADAVVVSASSNTALIPLGVKTVASVPGVDSFTYTETGSAGSATISYVGDDDGVRNGVCRSYVPDGIVAGTDFCQLSRTILTTTGGVDPGEDMALVAEIFPSATDLTNNYVEFTDIATFANGADAYFSPSEGTGGLNIAREQPPLITDGLAYKDSIVAVAPTARRGITISLLAVDGADGLMDSDGIEMTAPAVATERYLASPNPLDEGTGSSGVWFFLIYTNGTVAENLENTVRSLARVLNLRSVAWYGAYISADSDPPGKLIIHERSLTETPSVIRAFRNHKAWSPTMRLNAEGVFTRAANVVTVDVTTVTTAHHLRPGEQIDVVVGTASFPAGVKIITGTPTPLTFTYSEVGANAGPTFLAYTNNTADIELDDTLLANSWVASASQQWDAFPPILQSTVGGVTNTLYRIAQFGDVAIFFSNEGLWRLTGSSPTDFQLRPFPDGGENVRLFAPNTVAKIQRGVFALAEDGVVQVMESVYKAKVSKPVEKLFREFTSGSEVLKAAVKQYAFAVGNDAEQEYWLFLPDETSATPTTPTQAYVFSTKAGGWTRYIGNTLTATYARTDQRMYFASPSGGPLLRERRDVAPSDYQHADGTGVAWTVEFVPFKGKSPGGEKQWVKAQLNVENSSTIPMPDTMDMFFSTSNDGHSTWWGNEHTAFGDGIFATYTPLEVCRGLALGARLAHDTPAEWPRVKGLALYYNDSQALRKGK